MIIDLYQTVNITPKGCHGFTEELDLLQKSQKIHH